MTLGGFNRRLRNILVLIYGFHTGSDSLVPHTKPRTMSNDEDREQRLEEAGWTTGTASELLDLTPADEMIIELRLRLRDRLKELRDEQGLTQQELADRMGTSQARVSHMENGSDTVSTDALIASLVELGADRKDIGRAIAAD